MTEPLLYVVVCDKWHLATGPVVGLKTATRLARSMTNDPNSKCIYVPVPLKFTGEVVYEPEGDVKAKSSNTGGYL